jgi:hypothetical protein
VGCALARWGDVTPTARLMPQQQRVTNFQSRIAEILEYLHPEQDPGREQGRATESNDD